MRGAGNPSALKAESQGQQQWKKIEADKEGRLVATQGQRAESAEADGKPADHRRGDEALGIGGRKGPWHPGCDPQSSPKSRSPSRGTLRFSGTASSDPFLPSWSGREGRLPCFVWKGFPTFRSHLRMRPVSRRHSRRGLVGGSTFRRTPLSRSPLDKNPVHGHLSELQPVNEVNTKGQIFRASFGKNPRFQIELDKRPLSPGTSREASGVPCLNPRRGLTLLSPVCRDPAIGV